MRDKRIFGQISSDVGSLEVFLRQVSEDRDLYERLMEKPLEVLGNAGISLEEYATDEYSPEELAHEIASLVHLVVTGRVGFHIGEPAATMRDEKISKGMDVNWDHSTHSEWRYHLKIKTEAGTFAETDKIKTIEKDITFGLPGVSWKAYEEALTGPLISEKAFEIILSNIEESLKYARGVL